jgi:hypothetical protein
MQINSGWIVIPDEMIRHELVVSSITQGIDLADLFFYIPVNDASPTRGRSVARGRGGRGGGGEGAFLPCSAEME